MAPKAAKATAPTRKVPSRAVTKQPSTNGEEDAVSKSTNTTKKGKGVPKAAVTKTTTKTKVTKASVKANSSAKRAADADNSKPKAKTTKSTSKASAPAKKGFQKTFPNLPASLGKRTRNADDDGPEEGASSSKKRAKSSASGSEDITPKPKAKATGTKKTATKPAENEGNDRVKKVTGKRGRAADGDDEKQVATETKSKKARPIAKKGPIINKAPTQRLDVFVFGQGDNGELGLGSEKVDTGVKRPRLNQVLSAQNVGVVQVDAGGMHVIALTHDSQIYTWGINDQGTLGRDTTLVGSLNEDTGLNPREATATRMDMDVFPDGTVITSVAAGDSCTFAVTETGLVYGWGTFRGNEGIFGFTKDIKVQRTPMLIPGLKNIKEVKCGSNHVLALDKNGAVFAWGAGQHNQLGRRIVERTRIGGLTPREFGLPKKSIRYIACGEHHSFAIDKDNKVWAWGSNNFGQCGIPQGIGEDDSLIPVPTISETLSAADMKVLDGGVHHSIGINGNGDCLVWGRCDNSQLGIDLQDLSPGDVVRDDKDRIRLVQNPVPVPELKVFDVAAGSDFCVVTTDKGNAESWGFGDGYRTGQGTDEDTEEAARMESKWIRDTRVTQATVGGQYGVLMGPMAVEKLMNLSTGVSTSNGIKKGESSGGASNGVKDAESSGGAGKSEQKPDGGNPEVKTSTQGQPVTQFFPAVATSTDAGEPRTFPSVSKPTESKPKTNGGDVEMVDAE